MSQGSSNIRVDLGRLRMFADMLNSDTEQALKPGMSKAEQKVQQGVRFGGAIEAGQVRASRAVLAVALIQAEENTARQVAAATILAEAIQHIIDNYVHADQIAAQDLAMVEHYMSEAAAKAKAVLEPAPPPSGGGFFE